ncbi:MAG: hydrolase, partial [Verrucomicrobia bacterium]
GYGVVLAGDAVASRRVRDRELGLARMEAEGARPGSVEMILFEWLERAGTDEFRKVLEWVK